MQWILRTGFSLLKPLTWITSSAVIPSNSTCQMILMAIHLKNSASGFHDMKYMRDPFIWSKSMSRIAFFPPTISKTEIHRTFL